MTAAICARCGSTECEAHITAYGVDTHPEFEGDMLVLNPLALEQPEGYEVEAVCQLCGHVRYLHNTEWSFA